jgi:hypothetical protein
MKLLNNTKIPKTALETILVAAGRSVNAKTSGVVVQVNPSRYRMSGMAYECWQVRWKPLKRWTTTNSGEFKISIPKEGDPLDLAERFFHVAQHEFGHIRDYQHGGRNRMEFSHKINERRTHSI